MSVYFIVQEKVLDEAMMEEYGKLAGPTLAGVNVKPLVVDNNVQPIEGEWHGSRVVVLEFDTEESFRGWYDSPGYQEAVKLRLAATDSRGILAQGVE